MPARTRTLSIGAAATLVARNHVLEAELHRRLGLLAGGDGGDGGDGSSDSTARVVAEAAMAHAWRAQLWAELLPVSVGVPRAEDLVGEAVSLISPQIEALIRGAPDLAELVAEIQRALAGHYTELSESLSAVSDGPIVLTARRSADDARAMASSDEIRKGHEAASFSLVNALFKGLTRPLH